MKPGQYAPDTPSLAVREREEKQIPGLKVRYTLTCSEGTLSIYAAFNRLKYLVVQIAQIHF